jgi:DNA-binding transcriptional ArsR family regulator
MRRRSGGVSSQNCPTGRNAQRSPAPHRIDISRIGDILHSMTADEQIAILKALGNDTRLKILGWLKDPQRQFGRQEVGDFEEDGVCVSLIQKKCGLSQSTVSAYMALLTRVGLVKVKRVGQWTYYRRDEDAIRRFVRDFRTLLQ